MARARARLSLKGRALQLLAQRDQSRLELRGKLLRHLAAEARSRAAAGESAAEDGNDPREAAEAEVEAVLQWLEGQGYLSAERFVESRVNARQARFGNRRIGAELAQHGVSLTPEQSQALQATELERGAAVRERRFPEPPRDAVERAAQARFLANRGFSPDVIQRLLRR